MMQKNWNISLLISITGCGDAQSLYRLFT